LRHNASSDSIRRRPRVQIGADSLSWLPLAMPTTSNTPVQARNTALCSVGLALLSLAPTLRGQQLQTVVPAQFATAEGGTTGNIWRAGLNRVQCFYDTSNLTGIGIDHPISISGIEFRLGGGATTNVVTYPSVEVYLQYAVHDFQAPLLDFDQNRTVAMPTTPNFSGPLTTRAVAGTVPNGYFLDVPLSAPFLFDPSLAQDLLIEIVILAPPNPPLGNPVSASFNNPAHLASSVRSLGSTTATSGTLSAFAPVVRLRYDVLAGTATHTTAGAGCNQLTRAFYERFAGGAADLGGRTVRLQPNARGGYDVSVQSGASIAAPSTPGLALGDDQISSPVALPFTFHHPGGSTGTVLVDSNGSIHLDPIGSSIPGGPATALLGVNGTRLCAAMMDLLPDGATNSQNVFASVDPNDPSTFLITWWQVPCVGATSGTSTFQIALRDNGTQDSVELRYGSLTNNATTHGGACIVGYKAGQEPLGFDPGSRDLTAGSFATVAELGPLSLAPLQRPILGTTTTYQLRNVRANPGVSMLLASFAPPTSVALTTLGFAAPGCFAHVDPSSLANVGNLVLTAPIGTATMVWPAAPGLAGVQMHFQALSLAPGENGLGAVTSNRVTARLGIL
jgi:hypothetical protein